MKYCKLLFIVAILLILIGGVSAAENITNETDTPLEQSEISEPLTQEVINDNNNISVTNEDTLSVSTDETETEVLRVSDTSSYQGIYDTCTVEDRTFKLGKYKSTISKTKFTNMYTAREVEDYYWEQGGSDCFDSGEKIGDFTCGSEGVYYEFQVKTNKVIKQKIGIGYKGDKLKKLKTFKSKSKAKKYKKKLNKNCYYKIKKNNKRYVVYKVVPKYKKIVTKKARVYMIFAYGPCQYGVDNYKYVISLTTKYENPGYDVVKGWTGKYKVSSTFLGLKKAKNKTY